MLSLVVGALSAIGAAAVAITKTLAVVGLAIDGLKVVANAILGLSKALGFIKQETDVEELGEKALQAEVDENSGIKFEDFDSFKDYIKALEDYEIDDDKRILYTEQEIVEKGMEIASALVIEEMPDFPLVDFFGIVDKNPTYFNEARLMEMSKYIKEGDSTIGDIVKYMDGSEKNTTKLNLIEDKLTTVEKNINPTISTFEAMGNILEAKAKIKD